MEEGGGCVRTYSMDRIDYGVILPLLHTLHYVLYSNILNDSWTCGSAIFLLLLRETDKSIDFLRSSGESPKCGSLLSESKKSADITTRQ